MPGSRLSPPDSPPPTTTTTSCGARSSRDEESRARGGTAPPGPTRRVALGECGRASARDRGDDTTVGCHQPVSDPAERQKLPQHRGGDGRCQGGRRPRAHATDVHEAGAAPRPQEQIPLGQPALRRRFLAAARPVIEPPTRAGADLHGRPRPHRPARRAHPARRRPPAGVRRPQSDPDHLRPPGRSGHLGVCSATTSQESNPPGGGTACRLA